MQLPQSNHSALNQVQRLIKLPQFRRFSQRGQAKGKTRERFAITGILSRGADSQFAINGEDLHIDQHTWVFGEMRYGLTARVTCENRGALTYALKIMTT